MKFVPSFTMLASVGMLLAPAHFCTAQNAITQRPLTDWVEFRDTLKPGSNEARDQRYKVIPWQDSEKKLLTQHLNYVHTKAPGLLARGAGTQNIRLYRAKLAGYAKGSDHFIVLDGKSFPTRGMNWTRRIIIHELCHTADHYRKISSSETFRKVIEPKLILATQLLKKEGLTPRQAAALPLGERRKKIKNLIRTQTGLPSAYASTNLSECLAEIVSFWVDDLYHYNPPTALLPLLKDFTQKNALPSPAVKAFTTAQNLYRQGKFKDAITQLNAAVKTDPHFYQAIALRGHTYERLGNITLAEQDLRKTIALIPRHEHGYAYYFSEWKRIKDKASKTE